MTALPAGARYVYDMKVTGRAKVHGIEGVEITARESACSHSKKTIERAFVAQLTDTHCRYLAVLRNDGEVRNYITFLDGEAFMPNWASAKTTAAMKPIFPPRAISRERRGCDRCR